MSGRRVVVTGGSGFLGSHLCDAFLASGDEVVAVDNLSTGHRRNIAHLAGHPRFTFVEADICDGIRVDGPVDVVMQFASPASPPRYLALAIETLRVGSVGHEHALQFAAAKGARLILASTSEVYGDPAVHPQVETYWGNVNSIGPRSCYDEAKRYAEALTMAYVRHRNVDAGIVRIFNSILADEQVLYDDGVELRREPIGALAERLGATSSDLSGYRVPSFDEAGAITSADAVALVGHAPTGPCFEVKLRYGRTIRVTGDHSVFVEGRDGRPEALPVSSLTRAHRVAIAGRIEVPERDRRIVRTTDATDALGMDPWTVNVRWDLLGSAIWRRREEAVGYLRARGGWRSEAAMWSSLRRMRDDDRAPLALVRRLGIAIAPEAMLSPRSSGRTSMVPYLVDLNDEFLWLLGLFVAGGTVHESRGDALITLSCDDDTLDRAQKILERDLDQHAVRAPASDARASALFVHSTLVVRLFEHLGFTSGAERIPGWVLGLPLERLGWFLEGYREGDGVHSGKKLEAAERHEFSTTSCALKDDLVVALGRFGLVPSIGRYESSLRGKRFPFWRLTVPKVSPWSPLEWHRGTSQVLQSRRYGDVVFAAVKAITEVPATDLVYDFCVPGRENFLAGTGVLAHNTYGPRLDPDDGRVVSNFLAQALRGEPLTIFGDGRQTRSFCYVEDEVRGFLALLDSDELGPINIGNPGEFTMLELAQHVLAVTGSSSEIVFRPLPQDDPTQRRPDITLAREKLGWEPRVQLREGLERTAAWFKDNL